MGITKHEVPGGWVELRDTDEVSERFARRMRALQFQMSTNADVMKVISSQDDLKGALEANPELAVQVGAAISSAMPVIDQLGDVTIVARVTSWSFGMPCTEDSVLDLPGPAYEALKELCADTLAAIRVDTEPSPDPKATTPATTDSETQ